MDQQLSAGQKVEYFEKLWCYLSCASSREFDMNILHISTGSEDVSGRIAYELHCGLKKHGHNSHVLFKHNSRSSDKNVAQIRSYSSYFYCKLIKKTKQTIGFNRKIKSNPNYHFNNKCENTNLLFAKNILKQVSFNPDFIILYWVNDTINSKTIYQLSKLSGAAILWYFMDMAPLTGGCHYAWDCEGYKRKCGNCPALNSTNEKDLSWKNLAKKKFFLSQTNLISIAPTEWIYKQTKESMLFKGGKIYKISLAKSTEVFKPYNKQIARKSFDLPSCKKVVFWGATTFSQKRKGVKYLLEALKHLKENFSASNYDKEILLLIAGNHNSKMFEHLPFDFKYVGMLDNGKELATAYQAADIFICPSIEDTGPLMINESIMCGIPVVSFDMGVAPDLVHNRKTGYRAKLKDSIDLANGINSILSLNALEYTKMSKNCRELGLKLCSPSVQSQAFDKLFKNLKSDIKE